MVKDGRPQNEIHCLQLAMSKKKTTQQMQELAKKVDKYGKGKCLSPQYINSNTDLLWKCGDEKHPPFYKKAAYVIPGHWCEKCGGSEKGTIEKAKLLATRWGAKCLSENYENARAQLIWECKKGHQFEKSYNRVQQAKKFPCRICNKRPIVTIEDMHKLAATHEGGKCLSNVYTNANTRLIWKCKVKTHPSWDAIPNSIKRERGSWCIKCAKKEKGTIEEMQQIAKERMGKCLSSVYVNTETKLEWQCSRGHQWPATPHAIKAGQWCPYCATNNSRGEQICLAFFEQLFQSEFKRIKPDWLINIQTKGKLQLDGFNEKLMLAFEHQGIQHYQFVKKKFHKTNDHFLLGQENDKIKEELCKKNKVTLILVPEIPTKIKINDLKNYIKAECIKNGFPLPGDYDKIEVIPPKLYDEDEKKLKELKVYAIQKGGKCLSDKFLGMRIPYSGNVN